MKRISIGNPMLIAQLEALAERERRTPADTLRLLLQLGIREARRAGEITYALASPADVVEPQFDNLVRFPTPPTP